MGIQESTLLFKGINQSNLQSKKCRMIGETAPENQYQREMSKALKQSEVSSGLKFLNVPNNVFQAFQGKLF